MAAGVAVAVKAVRPQCKVMAVEPEGKCLKDSLRAKRRLWSDPPGLVNTKAGNFGRERKEMILLVSYFQKESSKSK